MVDLTNFFKEGDEAPPPMPECRPAKDVFKEIYEDELSIIALAVLPTLLTHHNGNTTEGVIKDSFYVAKLFLAERDKRGG